MYIRKIIKNRFDKFESYNKTHNFDKLIYRLILEHDNEYCEKCYHNGNEPYINNKLNFLLLYVRLNCKKIRIKEFKTEYKNHIWEFNDYYFQKIYYQGSIYLKIYNKSDKRILLNIQCKKYEKSN